jgi:hypothetical protein
MALRTPERSEAFAMAFTSPQSVLEPVVSRPPKDSSTAYCFAATKDKPSGGRQIRWDPNAPGCFGVSQDDGSFRYCTPDGGSVCFKLYVSAGGATDEPGLRPAPLSTAWAHWTFVPGQAGTILFAHHNSDQLLQTCVPGAALLGTGAKGVHESRVSLCQEDTFTSALTALTVSADGARAGVGQEDGSLVFWQPTPTPTHATQPPVVFANAHRGPITALALLCESMPEHQLQVTVAVSGSVDQQLRVWDLNAGAPLHRIVVGDASALSSPLSFLHLHLLSPGAAAAAAAHQGEPCVLVLAGSADGRCEAWSLAASTPPQQAACWQAASASPVLHLELDAASASVVAVGEGGGGPEVEVRSCPSWNLLAQHALPLDETFGPEASPVVSAQLELPSALPRRRRLLVCRASGEALQWGLPSLDTDLAEVVQGVPGVQGSGKEPRSRARKLDYTEAVVVVVEEEEKEGDDHHDGDDDNYEIEAAQTEDEAPRAQVPMTTRTVPAATRGLATAFAVAAEEEDSEEGCVTEEDAPRTRVPVALSLGLRAASRPVHAPSPAPSPAAAAAAAAARSAYAAAAEAAARAATPQSVDLPSLAGERFDNPARIRALLEPVPAGPPLSSLAAPKLNSSALVEQQLATHDQTAFGTSDAKRDAAAATLRRANRESTARLNTPLDSVGRYHDLPSLEPTGPPRAARMPASRRREPRWHAARALEPELLALFVPEREPELLDTAASDELLGDSEPYAFGSGLAAVGAGIDARRGAAVGLGARLPLA